jgi:ligand-binding sensor protein
MNIAKFFLERPIIAWLLVILIAASLGWGSSVKLRDMREHERLDRLQTDTERRSIEIMSQTLNGNLMGAVAVLGLIDEGVKLEALGKLPANNPKVLPTLESIGRSYDAEGIFVVAKNGVIASSWDNAGKPSTNLNVKFRPYYQMAMQGMDNVYAAVSIARGDRALYFAAPIFNENTSGTEAIGALVARTGLLKVDNLLRDGADIAFLLSPQGVVFASSRTEWIGYLSGKPTPERLQAIRDLKQFGNMFDSKEPTLLPFALTEGLLHFEGKRFALASAKVQWNDPFGEWQLVMMEDIERSLPVAGRFWMGSGIALAVLLIGILILKTLQSNYRQALAGQQLAVYAREQETSATHKERLASATVSMQRAKTLAELVQIFLEEAHAMLEAFQGVVYVAAKDGGTLHLAGSYACVDQPAPILALGEGLLGQCAVERRGQTIQLESGRFAMIRSGLGETAPTAVMIAPVLLNESLLGVVEIAVLRTTEPSGQARFDEMISLLGMNIEIAQRRENMEEQLVTLRLTEEKLDKLEDAERFNRLAQGRERRVLDLKREINALAEAAGKPAPYATSLVEPVGDHDIPPHPDYRTTLDDDGKALQLGELVDLDELQRLLTNFCESVGIASAIIDLDGKILAAARWQRACTDFHRINPESCARCIESDTGLALQLREGSEFTMYKCKNGMTDAAAPIIIEGQHLANVFIGQFHVEAPNIVFFRNQARQFGYNESDYIEAVAAAPVINEQRLPAILSFLSGFARMISTMSLARRRADLAQQTLRQQAELLQHERIAALSLAEDAEQARIALEAIAKESQS